MLLLSGRQETNFPYFLPIIVTFSKKEEAKIIMHKPAKKRISVMGKMGVCSWEISERKEKGIRRKWRQAYLKEKKKKAERKMKIWKWKEKEKEEA